MTKNELNEPLRADIASCSALLGALFLHKPETEEARVVIDAIRQASMEEWPFGSYDDLAAVKVLIAESSEMDEASLIQSLANDYQRLFVGPFALAAPPWGSVYLDYESVICGCSTVALQQWMRANGLIATLDHNEPEDHIGLMFMLLSWLSSNRPELVPEYLEEHFCTWAPHFCDLMQEKAETPFYRGIALLARVTLTSLMNELCLHMAKQKLYR